MNIECMCRVCETVHGLKNIFDEENEELLLMLRSVANISITADDYLPKYICNLCSRRLRLSYDFKVQCEMTDQTLREMLESAPFVPKELRENHRTENDLEDSWKPTHKTNLQIEPANEYLFSNFDDDVKIGKIEEEHLEDEENLEIVNSEAFANEDVEKLEELFNGDGDCDNVESQEEVSIEESIPVASAVQEKENENSLSVTENTIKFDERVDGDIVANTRQISDNQIQRDDTPQEIFQFVVNKSGEIIQDSFPADGTVVNSNDTQIVLALETTIDTTPAEPDKKKYPRRKVPKTFSCNTCSATFTEFAELNAHKKTHGRLRFQCHLCDKKFARRNGLEDHLATHDGKKVPCHLCDKQCSNRGNLFRHIRQCHNKIKPHACEICGVRFARRSSLKAHASCHSEKRDHDCEICGKKFKTIFYLRTHMRVHLPAAERMQRIAQKKRKEQLCICPHCGKKSTQLSTHITHMKIHSDVKPHVCKICGKGFHFKQSLTTHMLCHTGEKPFRCEICGKEFRQIAHLSTHKLSIHTQERPHKCRYCQKAFVGSGTLKVHERIHTGEKPYECKLCPAKFIDSNGLKKHTIRVHSNVEEQTKDVDSNDAIQDQLNKFGIYDQKHFVQIDDSQIDELNMNPDQLNYQQEIAMDQLNVYIDELHHGYTEIIETGSIQLDDCLPKQICESCIQALYEAYIFKRKCEMTDKKFREFIKLEEGSTSTSNDYVINFPENFSIDSNICEEIIHYVPETANELQGCSDKMADVIVKEEIDFYLVDEQPEDEHTTVSNYDPSIDALTAEIETHTEEDYEDMYDSNHDCDAFGDFIVEEVSEISKEYETSRHDEIDNGEDFESTLTGSNPKPTNRKLFCCNSCPETFTSFNELNAHKKSHGEKRFQCPTCQKRFSRHYRLRDHMLTHGEQIKLPCNLCDKTYTNRGNLERHIRHCHNKEKPHSCDICGMSFARKATLKMHISVHSDVREFECEKCDKKFKTEYYLSVHQKSHIPIELRPQKRPKQKRKVQICICPYCGKKSTSLSLHLNHLRTHTGEKPFECPTCGKRFTFKQSLKTHLLMHSGEKPFICDSCGMAFRQIGHLKGHKLAVHSGLKQHKCQYCKKSFALRSNLTIHERLHTGEKPYACTICSKKFNDSNGLKRHKLSHTRNGQVETVSVQEIKQKSDPIKVEDGGDLNQLNVSLDQLNVYLDELGNEYTEIIEAETTLETSA